MQKILTGSNIKWKSAVEVDPEEDDSEDSKEKELHMLIGGFDNRRLKFKGRVRIEPFCSDGFNGSFCVMQRDSVRRTPIAFA